MQEAQMLRPEELPDPILAGQAQMVPGPALDSRVESKPPAGEFPGQLARMQVEGRRALHEIEEVRRVNASMFPRDLPLLSNLAYAGVCTEASQAGGDYFDFLDLGPHRLGIAVGDVSGKGMSAALVRAAVQASIRTLSFAGITEPAQLLHLVNRLLLGSTPDGMYATLFLGVYDERTRLLRYVNCGHPSPILQGGNSFTRLESTTTVLGCFGDWRCATAGVTLSPGETLLIYTDGASETASADGEEFGAIRLQRLLEESAAQPVSALLRRALDALRDFGAESRRDDVTLVALRCLDVFP
jgi:phosphoserine phosphatase RsbU/P